MSLKKFWIIFFVLCLPAPAFSAADNGNGNLHIGQLEIHPYFSVQETFNDNIYATPNRTPTEAVSDFITTFTPGLRLFLPVGQHQLSAEYNVVSAKYMNHPSENTTDQNGQVIGDFKFGSLFGLKLMDVYTKGHEPRYLSVTGQIERYERNAATASATYQLADRSKIQVDYTRTGYSYEISPYRSRDEDLISTYFFYRFLPKTSAFVEYDYGKASYNIKVNGLDSSINRGWLGLTWDISAYTKGTVKGGYVQKRFENSTKQDESTWVASADVTHAFTDYNSLKLVALRDVNESAALGPNYYITTGAFAEYTHKLTYKIAAKARASYGVDEYPTPAFGETTARTDRTLLCGAGLQYQMRDWLDFALDYYYRNRRSTIDTHDLILNTYALTVNFAL